MSETLAGKLKTVNSMRDRRLRKRGIEGERSFEEGEKGGGGRSLKERVREALKKKEKRGEGER